VHVQLIDTSVMLFTCCGFFYSDSRIYGERQESGSLDAVVATASRQLEDAQVSSSN